MTKHIVTSVATLMIVFGFLVFNIDGQKKTAEPLPIIFAVLNDGKIIEPIAHIENNKLTNSVGGDAEQAKKIAFTNLYYKTKTRYKLIFGGKDNGAIKVESFNAEADCSSNMAQVSVTTKRANLRGFVMGLSTDKTNKNAGSRIRRLPTRSERNEIEALVRAEFAKHKVNKSKIADFKYHNLTALDVDNDGTAEQVGTFFVPTSAKDRALLFFIAQKNKKGRYYFAFSDFRTITEKEVMSEDIKALDQGIYNELLLDVFDYDDDGVSEIFTITQGFEGSTFSSYRREAAKWVQTFTGSNYHCGY